MEMKRKRNSFNCIVYLAAAIFLAVPVQAYVARQVRVVEGLIQDVTSDSIEVRGRDYSIKGVPLKDPSGKNIHKAILTKGKKVEIYFKEGIIVEVIVHDYMLE